MPPRPSSTGLVMGCPSADADSTTHRVQAPIESGYFSRMTPKLRPVMT